MQKIVSGRLFFEHSIPSRKHTWNNFDELP